MTYTTKELIAAFMARDLQDGENVVVGANLPVPRAGVLLAHLHHGPNMTIGLSATQTNLLKEPVLQPFKYNRDFRAARWAESYMQHHETFDSPKLMSDVFFVGGIQIDQFGNSNLIGVGTDYRRLRFRGPGAIGTTTMTTYTKRYHLYLNSHDPRVLVERCDFITAFGWGRGGADARTKLGLPGGGPKYCITPLCVFDFEEETKRMRLRSVHPGVTVEEVLARTGFAPIIAPRVPETEAPSADEMEILRQRVDVEGVLRS
ncbi:MAG: CoA synthetase [Candidatus Rokubacteria bacterium]|nr:CoA synthetase [Candidatus Rokubacteria bacterium]